MFNTKKNIFVNSRQGKIISQFQVTPENITIITIQIGFEVVTCYSKNDHDYLDQFNKEVELNQ